MVAGICGFYAGVLMTASNLVSVDSAAAGDHNAMGVILSTVATVFVAVAVYVAAVVITNGVDTVVAGRLPPDRSAPAARCRGALAARRDRAGHHLLALVGAVTGMLAGAVVGDVARTVLVAR